MQIIFILYKRFEISQFCTMEGFFTAIIDEFPHYLRKKHAREIFVAIISLISYIIGLSMVTEVFILIYHKIPTYLSV